MTRLKILHVVNALEPGGMEHVLLRYKARLEPRGIDMGALCVLGPGALAERFGADRVTALNKGEGLAWGLPLKVRRFVRAYAPDVVHTHNLGPLIYTVPALLGTGVPLLHGVHAQLLPTDFTGNRLALRRWLYKRCKVIHTVSSDGIEELERLGLAPARKLRAIVNGVDPEAFAPGDKAAARAALGLPDAGVVLGIAARFRRTKRHAELIQAMASVPESVCLAIIGDGVERPNIEAEIARSPAKERIFLLGHRDDMAQCYQALDLLVMPSMNEGLSNVMLEAMACGVPALANNACGNGETIDHETNGWLLDLTRPEQIAAALTELVADPETLAQVGAAAREKVRKDFSFDVTVDRYEAVYRELAQR